MHHFHIVEPLGRAQFLDGWRAANASVDRRHASLLQAPYQDIYQARYQAPYEAPQQVVAAAEARVEGEGEGEGAEQPPPNPAPPLDPLPPDVGPQPRRGRNARRNRNRRLPRRPMQDSDDPPNALLHYLDGALTWAAISSLANWAVADCGSMCECVYAVGCREAVAARPGVPPSSPVSRLAGWDCVRRGCCRALTAADLGAHAESTGYT